MGMTEDSQFPTENKIVVHEDWLHKICKMEKVAKDAKKRHSGLLKGEFRS